MEAKKDIYLESYFSNMVNEKYFPQEYHFSSAHSLQLMKRPKRLDSYRIFLLVTLGVLSLVAVNVLCICVLVVRDIFSETSTGASPFFEISKKSNNPQTFLPFEEFSLLRPNLPRTSNFGNVNLTQSFLDILKEFPQSSITSKSHIRRWQDHLRHLNCRSVDHLRVQVGGIASGWTKDVHRGVLKDGRLVAVKVVSMSGHDMTTCLEVGDTVETCYEKSATKFLRELAFQWHLRHQSLIGLKGFCIPDGERHPGHLMTITELGDPVDLIGLLQMPWEERLRIMHDLTTLIEFMSQTPLGSLVLNDFRRQQFVLVNGQLKLSDLDDIGFEEKQCQSSDDCVFSLAKHEALTYSYSVPTFRSTCIRQKDGNHGTCRAWNERTNIARASNQFASFLLFHGSPRGLASDITSLTSLFQQSSQRHSGRSAVGNAAALRRKTAAILQSYIRGLYLPASTNSALQDYILLSNHNLHLTTDSTSSAPVINRSETVGLADMPSCELLVEGHGCRIAVFNPAEAAEYCSQLEECSGFLITNERTWSNHSFAYLRKVFTSADALQLHVMKGHQFFVRIGSNIAANSSNSDNNYNRSKTNLQILEPNEAFHNLDNVISQPPNQLTNST